MPIYVSVYRQPSIAQKVFCGLDDRMEWLKEDPVKWYVMESAVINAKVDIFCSK